MQSSSQLEANMYPCKKWGDTPKLWQELSSLDQQEYTWNCMLKVLGQEGQGIKLNEGEIIITWSLQRFQEMVWTCY